MRKRWTVAAPLLGGCRRPPDAFAVRNRLWTVSNLVNAIDQLNQKTTYVYDKLNRRTQAIDARGGLTNFVFDAADNLTRLQDAASPSNWTTFAYDKLNRRTQQTDPLNKNTTFAYDAADRRTSSTDRLGRVRNYSYDALDRLKGETWVAGAGSPANTFTFTYDAADNLRSAANTAGTYTLTYDKLNRVTYEQQLFGLSLTFSYDASDNRTRVDDSLGGVTTSVYDDANRLTRREFGGTGQTPLRIDVAWTDRNQLDTLTRYKWNAGAWQSIGSSVYHYDAALRLDNLQHKNAVGVAFSNTTYGYDVTHRLTSEQYNGGTAVNLGYDPANQLTSATGGRSESYGYDLNGNRNTTGYQTGIGNRLLNDGTYAYTYTDEGARDKKTLGASAETWTYGYDHNNRLVWARQAATDGGAATLTVTYTYDAFGQRVQEDRWTQATGVVTTRFAFDGVNLWADLNNANQPLMRRLYLDGVDQVFARLSAAGTAVWYATDRQGSIADYLDANGVAKYHFAYDSFGNATGSGADPSLADRLRYTGKEYDTDTKLQLNDHRWYDSRTGRWVNEDPIGLRAGDPNLHRYVRNSPTNATDPSGLQGPATGVRPAPGPVNQPPTTTNPNPSGGNRMSPNYPGRGNPNGPGVEEEKPLRLPGDHGDPVLLHPAASDPRDWSFEQLARYGNQKVRDREYERFIKNALREAEKEVPGDVIGIVEKALNAPTIDGSPIRIDVFEIRNLPVAYGLAKSKGLSHEQIKAVVERRPYGPSTALNEAAYNAYLERLKRLGIEPPTVDTLAEHLKQKGASPSVIEGLKKLPKDGGKWGGIWLMDMCPPEWNDWRFPDPGLILPVPNRWGKLGEALQQVQPQPAAAGAGAGKNSDRKRQLMDTLLRLAREADELAKRIANNALEGWMHKDIVVNVSIGVKNGQLVDIVALNDKWIRDERIRQGILREVEKIRQSHPRTIYIAEGIEYLANKRHAELTAMYYARKNGIQIITSGTSIGHCPTCYSELILQGIFPASPRRSYTLEEIGLIGEQVRNEAERALYGPLTCEGFKDFNRPNFK